MTDTQPKASKALRLAGELTFHGRFACESEDVAARRRFIRNESASHELYRLHEVNAVLLEALKEIASETYDEWTNGAKAQRIAQAAIAKAEEQA